MAYRVMNRLLQARQFLCCTHMDTEQSDNYDDHHDSPECAYILALSLLAILHTHHNTPKHFAKYSRFVDL